jgi:Sulfotransferase domain
MKRKVFCIGTLKTGTTSIGAALQRLGYNHAGFNPELLAALEKGELQKLLEFAREYDSFDDWPWAVGDLYVHLDAAFPGSKFIYTDRGLIDWARSYYRYCYCNPHWGYGDPSTFDDSFPDFVIERRDRKRRILQHFAMRPDSLLVIDVTAGEGWQKLCPFLQCEIPLEPFPHVNKTPDDPPQGVVMRRVI